MKSDTRELISTPFLQILLESAKKFGQSTPVTDSMSKADCLSKGRLKRGADVGIEYHTSKKIKNEIKDEIPTFSSCEYFEREFKSKEIKTEKVLGASSNVKEESKDEVSKDLTRDAVLDTLIAEYLNIVTPSIGKKFSKSKKLLQLSFSLKDVVEAIEIKLVRLNVKILVRKDMEERGSKLNH